ILGLLGIFMFSAQEKKYADSGMFTLGRLRPTACILRIKNGYQNHKNVLLSNGCFFIAPGEG
ncbi:hypothetical protein, partial [Vibrio sp. V39_P1S14PM300]|uniref:hypothetical protein n=1 Tax=Vibrio sp. V39_P1S14PM300 TaxID=1938690 RepID=UPI001F469C10